MLTFTYVKGGLASVQMDSLVGAVNDQCRLLVVKNLVAKYGTTGPGTTNIVQGYCGYGSTVAQLCSLMGGDQAKTYTTFNWTQGDVAVTLRIVDPGAGWTVSYTIEPQASAETIKKF